MRNLMGPPVLRRIGANHRREPGVTSRCGTVDHSGEYYQAPRKDIHGHRLLKNYKDTLAIPGNERNFITAVNCRLRKNVKCYATIVDGVRSKARLILSLPPNDTARIGQIEK